MIRFLLLFVVSGAAFAQTPHLPTPEEATRATDQHALEIISPEQYRNRLTTLQNLVSTCRQAISAEHCNSDAVGADVQVSLATGARTVRFGWLRSLLDDATHYDSSKETASAPKNGIPATLPASGSSPTGPAKASPANDPLTGTKVSPSAPHDELDDADAMVPLPTRLDQAGERLSADLRRLAEKTTEKQASPASIAAEHHALTAILADKEFRAATVGRTLKDRILEKIARWINRAINKLVSVGSKSKWIGVSAEIGFVIALCVALVWFLIRLEKQGRFGPGLFRAGVATGAPSERDWQLWLKDARLAAGSGAWREAIHFLYWASISRLESSGQWSPDRARTPREYLALLSETTTQRAELKSGLTALTRSFERTWYGGRPAAETDFQQAEQLAAALGAKSDAPPEWRGGLR